MTTAWLFGVAPQRPAELAEGELTVLAHFSGEQSQPTLRNVQPAVEAGNALLLADRVVRTRRREHHKLGEQEVSVV